MYDSGIVQTGLARPIWPFWAHKNQNNSEGSKGSSCPAESTGFKKAPRNAKVQKNKQNGPEAP